MNYIKPSYPSDYRKHKEEKHPSKKECRSTKAIFGNNLSFTIHLHVLPSV